MANIKKIKAKKIDFDILKNRKLNVKGQDSKKLNYCREIISQNRKIMMKKIRSVSKNVFLTINNEYLLLDFCEMYKNKSQAKKSDFYILKNRR